MSQLQHSIRTINIYREVRKTHSLEKSQTTDEILMIQRQRIATRIYIIFFILALVVIIIFSGLNSQIQSMKVLSRTESMFEQLKVQYSSSLLCPCSQILVLYSKFLSVKPATYRQVCSSYFISSNFIQLLWISDLYSSYYWNIDMKILSIQFRLLASLCSLAENTIQQKIKIFSS
ncbi:unnamed protein product [Rotaria sp. Silwood2]|nr:unnamed protein product [Rotaria sp. Silwood2]CAF4071034.1 unnamed protein product [Rotaria sp. Silwood2]